MTAERWAQLKDRFEAVLERAPAERSGFIERVCSGDDELRQELLRLLAGHEGAGSFLEGRDHSNDAPVFQVNEVVGRRFTVLRFVGRGGMGEVFEAADRDLGGHVAIKAVRPSLASDERFLRRLVQEIQLARKVTHPNVCRVFDLERHTGPSGEIVFLTMEFLDGETLSDRLRRNGPMNVSQALPLLRQLTAALDAAHAAGVIHRDFKSANVVLTGGASGETRAVVTDFGLARPVDTNPGDSITGTGHLIGTLAYMAPEQLEGNEATPASDIYALGVVLHEMLTGRRPAESPLPASQRDAIDPRWMQAIRRCLERDPSARFLSAGEVLHEVEKPVRLRPYRAIRWAALATLVLLAILTAWFFAGRLRSATASMTPGSSLLLTDVVNSTGDADLNALNELMRDQLSQSAHFNIWNRRNLPRVLERMGRHQGDEADAKVIREIALREGVPIAVFWTVTHPGDGYAINVRLEKPGMDSGRPEQHWDFTSAANTKSALFDSVRDSSRWIRLKVGEAAPEMASHDRAPQDITTSSWEALVAYMAAEKEKAADHPAEAIRMLDYALRLDPNFALAHMRLADIYMSMRRQEQGFQHWRTAIDESNRAHLSRKESLRIRGLYALDTEDLVAAETWFAAMSREYPFDYLAAFYLGAAQRMQGKLEAAIGTFQHAASLDPKQYYSYVELAKSYLTLKNLPEANIELGRIRALGEQTTADQFEGVARFLGSDAGLASAIFGRLLKSADPIAKSRGYLLLASLAAETGRSADAIAWLEVGLEYDRSRGDIPFQADKLINLAYLHLAAGARGKVRTEALDAVRLDSSPERLLKAGTLLARAGFLADASSMGRMTRQFPGVHKAEVASLRIDGEILAARHLFPQALDRLNRAAKMDQVSGYQEYLANAYAITGDGERAASYYQRIFDTPAVPWLNSAAEFPGIWTASLLKYATLERSLGHKDLADKLFVIYDDRTVKRESVLLAPSVPEPRL
ncbi:MAG TPA: protein kinase [Bryobacteraceae bacterium]|nr:protein kinase [Bryobacteraceae bacterium]